MIISDNAMYGTIGMHSYVRYPERAVHGSDAADQPRLRRLGPLVRRRGDHDHSEESEVADGIARAFAVKTRPVVVHCLTSAIQMSAWRRYEGGERLP